MAGRPEVNDFVLACREFSNQPSGPDSAFHLARINHDATIVMPRQYQLPFPESTPIEGNDQETKDRNLRGLWHELVQHLTDLGYITEADFVFYHEHRKQILKKSTYLLPVLEATRLYLKEEEGWEDLDKLLPPNAEAIDLFWLQQHLGTVTERISHHLSWEGQLPYPINYTIGSKNCIGRSIAYRLRTLSSNQFKFVTEGWLTAGQLDQLSGFFNQGFAIEGGLPLENGAFPETWWTVLTNVDLLLHLYIDNAPRRDESAMLYQLPPQEGVVQISLDDLGDRDLQKPKFDPKFYDRGMARRIIRSARRRQDRVDDGLDVRLLQVKLWQTSYYTGAIDGEWALRSHQALKAFISEETDKAPGKISSRAKRKVRSLLLPANHKQRVYAADLKGIIKLFKDSKQQERGSQEMLDSPEALNQLSDQAGISQEQLDEKVLQQDQVRDLYPDVLENTRRRVAYTRKALLPRIWGGIKRVFSWLKSKVVDLVDQLLGPVFSFVKLLLRRVRVAVQRFFSGFKYLANFILGRPIVTAVPAIKPDDPPVQFATRFAPDFDGTTYAPSAFAAGGGRLHSNHLRQMRRDMEYFIDGVIWIIKAIGKLSNPGGWVWLGWQIMRLRD